MSDKARRHPCELALHEWFFVGGRYLERDNETFMVGQMYVERFVPRVLKYDTPLVMIHGGGQTGTNFTTTADGRPGWFQDCDSLAG